MRNLFRRLFGGSPGPEQSGTDGSSDDTYAALRRQALSVQRSDAGILEPPPEAPAWGSLMETGYPEASATLLALGDGTTSLYLSTGGGVIGGQAHQNVREANAEFVEAANRHYQHLKPTDSFPLPAEGQTVFYVLTDSGVLTGAGREEELGLWEHPLSSLFHEGHRVITQLRLISEDTNGGD